MKPIVTPEEMAAADRAAISSGRPAEELMERAGHAVARAALEASGSRYGRRVIVVCGKGNNGGDGFVAARVLAREGLSVRCVSLGEMPSSGAAAHHLERMRAEGVESEEFVGTLGRADVAIDALFGTGFSGAVEGAAKDAIDALNGLGVPVIAVDIPSGVEGASGRVAGAAVRAAVTVTMGAEKLGTVLAPGSDYAGRVEVADIGIPIEGARIFVPESEDVAEVLPHRPATAHKRTSGSVAVVAGSLGMTGAALLAARSALRAGAGYVTLCSVPSVQSAAAEVPELLTRAAGDSVLGPREWSTFEEVIARANVVALGPGLGTGDGQRQLVERALSEVQVPLVLDADGLNALEGRAERLAQRTHPSVITPHPAELARLLGCSTGDIQADRLAAARRAAEQFGCVVLLKGYRSLIADPDEDRVVIDRVGGPELATAGTGDVLTGVVAALIARGTSLFDAAWAGAYVHGLAGVHARRAYAEVPLAGDVADQVPTALGGLSNAAGGG